MVFIGYMISEEKQVLVVRFEDLVEQKYSDPEQFVPVQNRWEWICFMHKMAKVYDQVIIVTENKYNLNPIIKDDIETLNKFQSDLGFIHVIIANDNQTRRYLENKCQGFKIVVLDRSSNPELSDKEIFVSMDSVANDYKVTAINKLAPLLVDIAKTPMSKSLDKLDKLGDDPVTAFQIQRGI